MARVSHNIEFAAMLECCRGHFVHASSSPTVGALGCAHRAADCSAKDPLSRSLADCQPVEQTYCMLGNP